MTFKPAHYGLFFGIDHIKAAQTHRETAPLKAAWERLAAPLPDDPLLAALGYGYRYRFSVDQAAGEQAVAHLLQSGAADETRLEALRRTVAILQIVELLRDHPAFDPAWMTRLTHQVNRLLAEPSNPANDAHLWETTLRVTAGVALENETLFNGGLAHFRQFIDSGEIHPEGYLKRITVGKTHRTLERQLDLVAALTLAAEAATLAGVNLWQYENRGTGIPTAAAYLVYYYFYPEQWRWDDPGVYTPDITRALFAENGAFLEIVALYTRPTALRGITLLLNEQRPMISRYGGMTTLSHAKAQIPERRGWFRQS